MKRGYMYAILLSIPLLLLAVAWQAGRFDALAAEARRLEASEESWVQENRKIEASIRVLSSRERAAALAESLGLEKAGADRRIRVTVKPRPAQASAQAAAQAQESSND
jgi:hypothetical protein